MRLFFIIGLLILSIEYVPAQIEIYGKVIDNYGLEMISAHVVELGTTNYVVTDEYGNFQLLVSDTSLIQISFLGFHDTIIETSKLQGDIIVLRSHEYFNELVLPYMHFSQTFTIGYFGDFSKMPFGFSSCYSRPYIESKAIVLSGNLYYKTNFRKNYDFKFFLKWFNVIHKDRYRLHIWGQYHDREVEIGLIKNKTKDFQLAFSNSFGNIIHVTPGILYRMEEYETNKVGYYLGFNRNFSKINQIWDMNYSYFTDYSEFSIAVYQGFFKSDPVLCNLQFGMIYNKFHNYNELNFLLRYRWRH